MIDQLDLRRPRLLAIDDSMMIHRLLKARLRGEHLEIHCAMSGFQGIESAKTLLPDVILLNIDLPDPDGFAVLEQLKADPATHDIPVIFLSATSNSELKIRGLEMGAIDFVTKPFDLGELKARVRAAIRIRRLINMLAQRAQVDGLTGLWNRAHFDHRLQDEITIALRHSACVALVLCDLDRFKNINDTYGHPFGDHVLEEFARILSDGRTGDVACRYGGEEFAVILPRSEAEEASGLAGRFQRTLNERAWEGARDLKVTASFGVTDLTLVTDSSVRGLIESADQALYSAKQSGRDCVVVANEEGRRMKLSA